METRKHENVRQVSPAALRPYTSVLILRCTSEDCSAAFRQLLTFMRRRVSGDDSTIVASGFQSWRDGMQSDSPDELDGFIYRRDSHPSWAMPGSEVLDTNHSLAVAIRRDSLIAIHCDPSLRETLQRWVDKQPRPPLVRIPSAIFQGAFTKGEVKSLWLRGTHARRTTRPDSKHISGRKLQSALNPLEDRTFAMNSARVALAEDQPRAALVGNVGSTPRKAVLWNRRADDFREFIVAVLEAFDLIESTLASGGGLERPFPVLAVETRDLSLVHGAFDISIVSPDDLAGPDVSDEMIEAAATLQDATLNVTGFPDSSDFVLEVGFSGKISGKLRGTLEAVPDAIRFSIGYEGEPYDGEPVRQILDCLQYADLLTIYYSSGHTVDGRTITLSGIRATVFEGWQFQDFTGFDITSEKPAGKTSQEIHDAIGVRGDDSLFGWVVKNRASGWLICDDGSGEIADFIHINPHGTLSLIHVKAALSRTSLRRVAVGPYEVVASQASKNVDYVETESLRRRSAACTLTRPAAWTDGRRVSDRSDFLEALECRSADDRSRVVIVQPHVSEAIYSRLRGVADAGGDGDRLRLNLLEALLNTTRAAVVSTGSDLEVIGSKD